MKHHPLSNEKSLLLAVFLGIILPCYVGIVINHEIRIPMKQAGFNGKYPAGFFDRGAFG